jgi:hypothetical protein
MCSLASVEKWRTGMGGTRISIHRIQVYAGIEPDSAPFF